MADPSPALARLGPAAASFLGRLPALVLALSCLRIAELAAGIQAGATLQESAWLAASAIGVDLINLARYLPGLFLYSLPWLLIRSRRGSFWALGLAWSLLVLIQAILLQYFLTARVPLGADFLAYSLKALHKTVVGGLALNVAVITGLTAALTCLWLGLVKTRDSRPLPPRSSAAVFALALIVLLLAPWRTDFASYENEDARNIKLSKLPYFFDDTLWYLTRSRTSSTSAMPSWSAKPGVFRYLNPKYPFLHAEQTPDSLGPYFRIRAGQPPNLVFIVVEGLGRSFSGPKASLGSFTPHLDRLAEHGLYFENFLAVQGRTFAVLPSLFGSLPFGDNGFSMLAERMPAHASLLSVLKGQGYYLKFYSGFDSDFDNESLFLKRQGVDSLVDMYTFGPGYTLSNAWGYADNDLVSRAIAGERLATRQPFVSVIKTVTMHSPYTFLGQSGFYTRFEQHLDQLGVPERRKPAYRAHRGIYTSILYADQALGRFFEETKNNPGYQNTVFIVVGDHRLPEIPMATRIARYHVPLIILSPLLKAPARIKSVSSHFDLAPSLLAFLSHNYGVKTPQAVTWLGSGLDMEPSFRNIHAFPMKQTKTNLVDFVSGTWFINQDQLYRLSDGMEIEPSYSGAALARVQAQFAAFRAANDQFAQSLALIPEQSAAQMAVYRATARAQPAVSETTRVAALTVREVRAPDAAQAGQLSIEAVFANTGTISTAVFVPLVVLLAADGREVSESYGEPQRLAAGETVSLRLPVESLGVAPGRYLLSVLPSHPDTGKNIGVGRYGIPIRFRSRRD